MKMSPQKTPLQKKQVLHCWNMGKDMGKDTTTTATDLFLRVNVFEGWR